MASFDNRFLDLAVRLADRQIGRTAPNPAVGCVIVKDGVILGTGATADGGRPHAEKIALEMAGDITGADVYVTLEPCAHHGKTPPCADALIQAKPARVFCPIQDPDPRVSGNGFAMLRAAGIEVIHPKLFLPDSLKPFIITKTQSRPMVTLKMATTIDGKIALGNGQSKWITSPFARRITRSMRAKYDAIMIGSGTMLADNPSLNIRHGGLDKHAPRPVIMDTHLRSPADANLFQIGKPIVFCKDASNARNYNADLYELPLNGNHVDLIEALKKLAELGVNSLLIEGGAKLAASALQASVVDEIIHVKSSKLIGGDGLGAIADLGLEDMGQLPEYELKSSTLIYDDVLTHYWHDKLIFSGIWPKRGT